MTRKYPGLYLYFDWLKGLVKLPPEVAMKIIENLYHYAKDGVEPPPLEEMHYSIIQDMYVDQMKRMKRLEMQGRVGGLVRVANAKERAQTNSDCGAYFADTSEDDEAIDREIAELFRQRRMQEGIV